MKDEKKKNWLQRHPVLTVIIALIVFGFISQLGKGTTVSNQQVTTAKAELTPTPTVAVTKGPTPTPVPFDNTLGNNYVAAEYTQKIKDAFSSMGVIQNIYVELNPADTSGKSKDEYIKSLRDGSVRITVDGDTWNNTSDSVKKDFVAGLIKVSFTNLGIYPDVTVSDGMRTVAEGSWNVWNGEADVTLK